MRISWRNSWYSGGKFKNAVRDLPTPRRKNKPLRKFILLFGVRQKHLFILATYLHLEVSVSPIPYSIILTPEAFDLFIIFLCLFQKISQEICARQREWDREKEPPMGKCYTTILFSLSFFRDIRHACPCNRHVSQATGSIWNSAASQATGWPWTYHFFLTLQSTIKWKLNCMIYSMVNIFFQISIYFQWLWISLWNIISIIIIYFNKK